jgi:hypothetical protein
MKYLEPYIDMIMFLLAVLIIGTLIKPPVDSKPEVNKILTEQAVDHELYYCHKTGFLFHHHLKHNGDSFYVDEPVINRENEPVLCQKDK